MATKANQPVAARAAEGSDEAMESGSSSNDSESSSRDSFNSD